MSGGVKGYILSGSKDNIRAGKTDYSIRPTHPLAGGYGCTLMHQAGTLYLAQYSAATTPISSDIPGALAVAGIPSQAGEMNGTIATDGWGTNGVMSDMDVALTRLGVVNPTISTAKMHLFGVSMGLYSCLRYALLNPTKVASVTGVVGMTDIISVFDTTPAQQASILSAWGVPDRAGLVASPANIYSSLTALNGVVPVQLFYSGGDTTVLPSTQTGAATLTGGTATQVSPSLNHAAAESILGLVGDLAPGNWAAVTDFMLNHDAV